MSEFNLIYWHKTNGTQLLAKRITSLVYKVMDPVSGEVRKTTKKVLMKDYCPDKNNRGIALRQIKNTCRKRKPQTLTKEFRAYLEGSA